MDKFNVISPTDNLDSLEQDYSNWTLLPHDMRMRANDHCMEIHGCTVTDLYNKYKNNITGLEDLIKFSEEPNNIVKEDGITLDDLIHSDKFAGQKLLSAQYANNPFIVIIDPDISSIEDLSNKYDSYNLLSTRNKSLSNEYSFSIWGYNVLNMYQLVLTRLTTIANNQDPNNLERISESTTIEESIDPLEDTIRSAYIHNKIFEKYCYIYNQYNTIYENCIYKNMIKSIEEKSKIINTLIFPSVVPFLTPKEMIDKSITFECNLNESYNKQLLNTDNSLDRLKLGWNPNIKISECTTDKDKSNIYFYAKARQLKYIESFVEYMDVKNVNIPDDIEYTKSILKPVYFVFEDSGKVGISFSSKLDIIYEFIGVNDTFKGFNKIYKEDNKYESIKVVVVFLNQSIYKNLMYKCEKFEDFSKIRGFSSVYSILTNTRNKFDPDSDKVLYANYIEMLLKILCTDSENNEINYDIYTYSDKAKVYIIYKGLFANYNQKRTEDIINLITNENNIKITLENSYYISKENIDNIYKNILAESIINTK